MIVEAVHPETGEKFSVDIPSLHPEDLNSLSTEYTTEEKLKSYIEQLDVSAEIKAMLFKFAKFTISVGKTLIKFGKKVLEIAMMLAAKYKSTTLGIILGALLTLLISTIPYLGPSLASFLGPFILLFGIGKGLWEDIKRDKPELAESITDAEKIFQPLHA